VVGVERFGDVDVELRFFPYRGAIRKARRGEKIFPAFPIGLVPWTQFSESFGTLAFKIP
jgi:hypothetical protein